MDKSETQTEKTTLKEQIQKQIKESEEETFLYTEKLSNENLSVILNPCNLYKRNQKELLKEIFK